MGPKRSERANERARIAVTNTQLSITRCGRDLSAKAGRRRAADRSRHDARHDRQASGRTATKFDGVDLFLFDPHVSIDSSDDDLKRLADKIRSERPGVGSLVAPVWPPTGGGSAMGSDEERKNVRHSGPQGMRDRQEAERHRHPQIRRRADRLGRESVPTGRRIRRATRRRSPRRSGKPPTWRSSHGERLAAEGEICWGGMHSVKRNVELLEMVEPPEDRRFPGRHGAHAALHHGLQRA